MNIKQLSNEILENLGGKVNILDAENCMTRLRVNVVDLSKVDTEKIQQIEGVMGVVSDESNYIQVVLGPGKVRDVMAVWNDEGIREKENRGQSTKDESGVTADWQKNKDRIKGKQKKSKFKESLRAIADIFTPMIPAFIASGVSNGLGRLLLVLMNDGYIPTNSFTELTQSMLALIGAGFLTYLVVFTGVNAARRFDVNPMLGGMIGIATIDNNINNISEILGWFNADSPNESILTTGAGGVLGVILGVWVLAKIENWIHSKMPAALDISFTPLLSMFITMPIYVLTIMPLMGYISVLIGNFLGLFITSDNIFVAGITGYLLAALFLPLVLVGLHRGLTPIYTMQLETLGYITLFPAVAMAGAGQVGAAIALYIKAKKLGNNNMRSIIEGGIIPGILGIGEPLIYGVTLPLIKPFITAGLGAGFGGAYVMIMGTSSVAFSPSGLLAITHILPEYIIHYIIGILISYIMGAIITYFFIPNSIIEKN